MNKFMVVLLVGLGAMAAGTALLSQDDIGSSNRPHFLGEENTSSFQGSLLKSNIGQGTNSSNAPSFTQSDVEFVAKTIWGEARSEGERGMTAVGKVIVNRTLHPKKWPNSVKEVVLQSKQFSCWNRRDPNRKLLSRVDHTDPTYQQAYEIALSLLKNPSYTSNGAFYYHTTHVSPEWAQTMKPIKKIGKHIFYSH